MQIHPTSIVKSDCRDFRRSSFIKIGPYFTEGLGLCGGQEASYLPEEASVTPRCPHGSDNLFPYKVP